MKVAAIGINPTDRKCRPRQSRRSPSSGIQQHYATDVRPGTNAGKYSGCNFAGQIVKIGLNPKVNFAIEDKVSASVTGRRLNGPPLVITPTLGLFVHVCTTGLPRHLAPTQRLHPPRIHSGTTPRPSPKMLPISHPRVQITSAALWSFAYQPHAPLFSLISTAVYYVDVAIILHALSHVIMYNLLRLAILLILGIRNDAKQDFPTHSVVR